MKTLRIVLLMLFEFLSCSDDVFTSGNMFRMNREILNHIMAGQEDRG